MNKKPILACACIALLFSSCSNASLSSQKNAYDTTQEQLLSILNTSQLPSEERYAIVNTIASNMLSVKDYSGAELFLTDWVNSHPDDEYNAYWLLMTAYAYLESGASPVAEYYFERIINDYPDLTVKDTSVHFLCLQHLIQISSSSANRIIYFNQLIDSFADNVSLTELYYRLALEYENEGDWDQAIKTLSLFLEQDDAGTIQISGYPNAYIQAKQMIAFNDSPKDWTFESLDALVESVKKAISNYNYIALDSYKAKVNFFAMSWRQSETDENSQVNFSMRGYMVGQRIRYSAELDESSSPTEAYLRTTGWSTYIDVWYLYFRKVNFPADPEIHGRWEWAGIYFGEKL